MFLNIDEILLFSGLHNYLTNDVHIGFFLNKYFHYCCMTAQYSHIERCKTILYHQGEQSVTLVTDMQRLYQGHMICPVVRMHVNTSPIVEAFL